MVVETVMSKAKQILALGIFAVMSLVSCTNDNPFTVTGNTEHFLQSYNPEMIDILWVLDTRSNTSVNNTSKNRLIDEARKFFIRLDSMASRQYRLAFSNFDGRMQPTYNPLTLYKNDGTLAERINRFDSFYGQTLNLAVGGLNQGFASANSVLTSTFVPTPNIPLVLVFVSDGDDESSASGDAVEFYAQKYLAAKQNRSDLLRVYSVNYVPGGSRCFTASAYADIDNGGFQDRYFRMADRLGGQKADVCSTWANTIDLTGLRLKDLPKRFQLARAARPESIQITVLSPTQVYQNIPSHYEAATNEIVFDAAPPEGSTIQVTYLPQ